MRKLFSIFNLILCFELIVGPLAPSMSLIPQAKAQSCGPGFKMDPVLNRCLTTAETANIINATANCAQGDVKCYRDNALAAFDKKRDEKGGLEDDKWGSDKGGFIQKGMTAAAVALPLIIGLKMLWGLKKSGAKCNSISLYAMMGGGVALLAGDMLSNGQHKKRLEGIEKEWEGIIKPDAASVTNKDDQKQNGTEAQSEAFEMLAKREDSMEKAAKMKSTFQAVATAAFAASAVMTTLEAIKLARAKAQMTAAGISGAGATAAVVNYNRTYAEVHCMPYQPSNADLQEEKEFFEQYEPGKGKDKFIGTQKPAKTSFIKRRYLENMMTTKNFASFMVLNDNLENLSLMNKSPSLDEYEHYEKSFKNTDIDKDPKSLTLIKKFVLEFFKGLMPVTEAIADDGIKAYEESLNAPKRNISSTQDSVLVKRARYLESVMQISLEVEEQQRRENMEFAQFKTKNPFVEFFTNISIIDSAYAACSKPCNIGSWVGTSVANSSGRCVCPSSTVPKCPTGGGSQCGPAFMNVCANISPNWNLASQTCNNALKKSGMVGADGKIDLANPKSKAAIAGMDMAKVDKFRSQFCQGKQNNNSACALAQKRYNELKPPGSSTVDASTLPSSRPKEKFETIKQESKSVPRNGGNPPQNFTGRPLEVKPRELIKAKGLDGLIRSPTTRAVLAGIFAGWSGFMFIHSLKQANISAERAKLLRSMKEEFNVTSGALNPCKSSDRDDPSKPTCYCYTAEGGRNPSRGGSAICQKLYAGRTIPNGRLSNNALGSTKICISNTGTADAACVCRQTKSCLKAGGINMSGINPGTMSMLQSGTNPIDRIADGSTDIANVNGAGAMNNALRLFDANKQLEKTLPEFAKEKAKLKGPIEGALRSAASNSGMTAPFSNSGPGFSESMSPKQAALMLEKELDESSGIQTSGGGDEIAGPGNAPAEEALEFGMTPDQLATQEGQIAEVMAQELDYGGNDINQGSKTNIFEVLSNRYQRSGMRRLFDEKGTTEAEKPAQSDIAQ
jgi:hypothetical protein